MGTHLQADPLSAAGRRGSIVYDYGVAILAAVLFALFTRTFIVQPFKIPSASMERGLQIGDHLLVNKLVFGPTIGALERRLLPVREVRRGDVVVFKYPREPRLDFVKRCVALPGDRVEIVDKVLYVNRRRVEDDGYAPRTDSRTYPRSPFLDDELRFRDNFGPYTVPAGHYFMLGDNRDRSHDSRFWGPVPAAALRGRALLIYWSFDGDAAADGNDRRWRGLPRRLLDGSRWDRALTVVR